MLNEALAAFRQALGSRLAAGYALGSLAHGGFSPLVSDVDLGLILADPPRLTDRLTVRRVAGAVRAGGSALHRRLSVFWGTPATLAGQARAAGSPRSTGWTCLSTGACSPGRTPVRRRPARTGPNCSWPGPSSR